MITPAYPKRPTITAGLRLVVLVMLATGFGCSPPRAGSDAKGETIGLTASRRLMGVSWKVTVHAATHPQAEQAAEAALDEVARLEGILSDYDPQSECSRLSAAAPVRREVSDDLWEVLAASRRFLEASEGGFDPAVGRLTALWRQSRKTGRLPREEKLEAALVTAGAGAVVLHETPRPEGKPLREVELPRAGTRLDFGGIGMGYAIDAAMRLLARRGITSAMVDASGDIAVSAAPPGRHAWRVAVAPLDPRDPEGPDEFLDLVNAAVTTSGDASQAVEIDGVRYSHVVDPRTGLGVRGPTAVTVIAADATTADALATAASVLGPAEGLALIEKTPGTAARFVWLEGQTIMKKRSRRWPRTPFERQ
jgi:FAD:protein FMN transferase